MKLERNNTTALVITHFAIRLDQGPAAPSFLHYLRKRAKRVVYIEHPFPHAPIQYSFMTIYANGGIIKSIKIPNIKGPSFLQFIYHFLLTHYFYLQSGLFFDICISCENLSLTSVMVYRKLGLIKRIVYNTMDYMEHRFKNPILNYVYHFIDRLACKNSDVIWVVTKKQIIQREKNKIDLKTCAPFIIVPIGYDMQEITTFSSNKINYYRLVFAGGLLEHAGPQLAIQAMPQLIKKFPKIKLTLIGSGNYEHKLKDLIKSLRISKNVEFLGFIKKYSQLIKILTSCSIGLAPYVPIPGSLSFYSDPSKIRLYLACGLPVITTHVTTIASEITKNNAGVVIEYNVNDLCKAVEILLKDKNRYAKFKQGTIKLSTKFDINHILNRAFRLV